MLEKVQIELTGIDDVKTNMQNAYTKIEELSAALYELSQALYRMGIEIGQPASEDVG